MNHIQIDGVQGEYTALGYRSARMSNIDGLSPMMGSSGDKHMEYDREKLLAQSRDFYANNAIYHGMIDRAAAYIVGGGFGLQMKTISPAYNKRVELLWKDYWKKPEVRQLLSGYKVERMIARELLLCGDTGSIKTDEALIQLIEAEQIAGKMPDRDGIKKNKRGRPLTYYVSQYQRGRINRNTATGFSPDDFLFLTNPDRPSSTRSVPPAQAAFPMLHRINDVCDSEAISWQLLSRMAVAIIREDGPGMGFAESAADSSKTSTGSDDDLTTRLTELDYALMFHGNPGESIKGIDRNLPGKDFPASIRMFMRLMGLPLGLPLEVTLLDWTKSNYSQSRAVLEQAYQTFMDWQMLMSLSYLTPILEWKMDEWVAKGLVKPRIKDGLAHDWIAPTFPWIDQLKEAQANGAKVDRGFCTHAGVLKSLNKDRSDEMDARVLEVEDAIERAKKIEAKTGEKVSWQIFAGLEAAHTAPAEEDKDDDENKKDDDKKGNPNAK